MATENRVVLELLQSHSSLVSADPVLKLGQKIYATGITDALNDGIKIGDGVTVYNSLKWQDFKLLKNIDLTAADVTYTLPEIVEGYQRVSLYWINGGTYKLTINDYSAVSIGYEGEGDGHIVVESDGTSWKVVEYEDSGSDANNHWFKNMQKLTCTYTHTSTTTTALAYGNIFYTNVTASIVFAKAFSTAPIVVAGTISSSGITWASYNAISTTDISIPRVLGGTLTDVGKFTYTAIGTWI